MSQLPRSATPRPPTGYLPPPHATTAEALQKWLWQCAAAGWDPTGGVGSSWTHDDNMAVQHLGWMIAVPPGSTHFDLFSLCAGVGPKAVMKNIIDAAPLDPYCAKAVALLGKQRLLYPDIKFAFAE